VKVAWLPKKAEKRARRWVRSQGKVCAKGSARRAFGRLDGLGTEVADGANCVGLMERAVAMLVLSSVCNGFVRLMRHVMRLTVRTRGSDRATWAPCGHQPTWAPCGHQPTGGGGGSERGRRVGLSMGWCGCGFWRKGSTRLEPRWQTS
jgi:hypothetical protein